LSAHIAQGADNGFKLLFFTAQVLRALRVGPNARIFELGGDFYEALLLVLEVKDTSAARPNGLRGPRAYWRWY
jgi:hypothetical protein